MNQKDWVEYFEAINGRKPSMQEFQEAREKGEFVVERKEATTPTIDCFCPTTTICENLATCSKTEKIDIFFQ